MLFILRSFFHIGTAPAKKILHCQRHLSKSPQYSPLTMFPSPTLTPYKTGIDSFFKATRPSSLTLDPVLFHILLDILLTPIQSKVPHPYAHIGISKFRITRTTENLAQAPYPTPESPYIANSKSINPRTLPPIPFHLHTTP